MKDFYSYDVIVIGSGHSGCEAALASARSGARTLLVTINLDSIALMPCNSAIGGPGRGQLVREIDALGGEIGKNTDKNYVHKRVLNMSKGPALRTIRSIVDKKRYSLSMKYTLENQKNLDIRQGLVIEINKNGDQIQIKTSDGILYFCSSAVVATGTFLRGRIFWGRFEKEAGRMGEINSQNLAKSLEKLGYRLGRLRTETPPKVDKKTIDFKNLEAQPGDEGTELFSYESIYDGRKQLTNHITYIDKSCIDYISKNLRNSSIIDKNLNSKSPRYCPSIEDKIEKFALKERHTIFIQPEGFETNEMYLHGLFTTFSEEIQGGIIKRIRGLENAVITRPGYGVEYDYLLPFQVNHGLESKNHKNLFFAGQINGSTGYEEAAAQGIIAGLNAALKAKNKNPIIVRREDGYIGVLIDDIVVKGITEPYRMLTSRNEFRLVHRHDNADQRMARFLSGAGHEKKALKIQRKYKKIEDAVLKMKRNRLFNKKSLEDLRQDLLGKNETDILKKRLKLNDPEFDGMVIDLKYDIYLNREKERMKAFLDSKNRAIPENIDYSKVKNISSEALSKLDHHKPISIEEASRLEGVGPMDIISLIVFIENVSRET